MARVLGCDVSAGRWMVVALAEDAAPEVRLHRTLDTVLADAADCIVVDIPIGPPTKGHRTADVRAREEVGPRRNSVFFTPVLEALQAPTHAEATRINRARTGRGTSQQAYALRHMVLEVAAAADGDARVHEGHPEVSFATLAGRHLAAAKKTWNGANERLELLRGAGVDLPVRLPAGHDAPIDDVLDAAVMAWTAKRVLEGTAIRFGGDDGAGAIWA